MNVHYLNEEKNCYFLSLTFDVTIQSSRKDIEEMIFFFFALLGKKTTKQKEAS